MPGRRSKRVPLSPHTAPAFARCAAHVDLGQRAMVRCVPSSPRVAALPPAVGAETLRVALVDAAREMGGWQDPAVGDTWQRCRAAIDETLSGIDSAVAVLTTTRELEVALTAVADLLAPLTAFTDAERELLALRRRSR